MTNQQTANEALAVYQANRSEPRAIVEELLEQFFGRISADRYEEQLLLVLEEMGRAP